MQQAHNIYNPSMKNRLLISLLALMLSAGLSLSCSRDKSEGKIIEFWTLQLSPYFDDYFRDLITRYESEHPGVTIRHIDIPYDAAIQKLMAAASAGTPPDIINLSSDFLAKFEKFGLFADLRNHDSEDSIRSRYLENALDECVYDNKIIALPWYLNTYAMIYNKDLLRKAGFDSSDVPKTFDEFTAFIREYKNRTGKYATFWNIGKDSYLPMMLGSEDIPMTDSQMTKALFNKPESSEKIAKWVDLVQGKYLSRDCVIRPGSAIIEPYQSGQVAMVFTGPVFLRQVKENAPGIYEETGIAPPVTGRTGKHELAAMALSVLSSSAHKQESYEFVRYILNAENQLRFAKMAPVFPSHNDALKDRYFTETDGSLETSARVMGAEYLPSATRLRSYLRHPRFDQLRNFFDEAIQNAALTRISTQDALDKAAKSWNAVLDEN
ncbi:MAG: sugar ABC transporter substrate-binding protein [Ignavibacteriaceae bacterium]|nr:sugar ABC transporter substrate-binding protein [Ignavibacteriaceae bacterium]